MFSANDMLADIICRNIDLLPIVFRFGISSNIGQTTIGEMCLEKGLEIDFFLSVINTYNSTEYFPRIDSIDLSLLTDFLTKTHDYHKSSTIPRLRGLMNELKGKFPDKQLIITLEKYLNEYIEKLIAHIDFEERNIFPLVKIGTSKGADNNHRNSMKNLKKLLNQHTNVETEISDLIVIIIQHIPDNSDVQLFYEVLHTLSHFEKEQIDHARFEDKILVPRLMKLLEI